MTGYQPKPKRYRLTWDDGEDLAGLQITAKGMSMDGILQLLPLIDKLGGDGEATSPDAGALETVMKRFARCLIEWNLLDDDGRPVPATYEGLMGQEIDLVIAIVRAWAEALVAVKPPLPNASAGGQRDPVEASIPMTTASPGS